MRRPSLRQEQGSALITAMAVLAILIMVAMPVLDMVDRTHKRTTTERVREVSYNVAEATMGAQTRALTVSWPHIAARALPAQCLRTSTSLRCPQAGMLAQDFANSDFDAASTWTVEVRDNVGSAANFYDRVALNATTCGGVTPCTWDSNGDGVLWVRSQATIRKRTRILVAQVRQQIVRIPIPRAAVVAGYVTTTNNGRKVIIDSKGCQAKHKPSNTCNSIQPAPVVVRCTTTTPSTSGDACLGYRSDQVAPNLFSMEPDAANLLTPAQLEQVRLFAIQAGTYRTSCPVNPADMQGEIVFVEPPTPTSPPLNCTFGAGGVANSVAAPGIFIINRGTITIGGDFTYYGVVYAANNLASPADTGILVRVSGGAYIQGGVFVDGPGGLVAGSTGLNISFDESAYDNLKGVSGNASHVQNSFRELPGRK
jgi:Tfp pilus assembly protein PilX